MEAYVCVSYGSLRVVLENPFAERGGGYFCVSMEYLRVCTGFKYFLLPKRGEYVLENVLDYIMYVILCRKEEEIYRLAVLVE
jgi:hypothetical protein